MSLDTAAEYALMLTAPAPDADVGGAGIAETLAESEEAAAVLEAEGDLAGLAEAAITAT
jgi:hypothetical protein